MKEYLQKIQRFYKEKKRMPSYSELASLFGFKSKNAASKLVDKLLEAGLVSKDDQGKLLPGKLFREIPLLGVVEAGFPTTAEQEELDTISLDEFLIKKKEATFLLKVQGDSMIDAGIMQGDLVLVERGCEPRIGDIVIANVDSGWTMKYLVKKGTHLVLQPANKNYPTIVPQSELKVAAVVRAVIRKYT